MMMKSEIGLDQIESSLRAMGWRRKHALPRHEGFHQLVMEYKPTREQRIGSNRLDAAFMWPVLNPIERVTVTYIPTMFGNLVTEVKAGNSGSRAMQNQQGWIVGMMGWSDIYDFKLLPRNVY